MNKAIEMHLAGNVYCDIFATATNVHYDYTGTINGWLNEEDTVTDDHYHAAVLYQLAGEENW